ncbi:facilitated trehalose transporter Tret1-like [Galleria mellonella]|uniref:Facilitated trehalose transporter Tret1-like n=1 Tax=Galleria mellonella TaxID=7137 RepID=A0ABM3MSW9_GALME|nr:facilitated trehalose transporter Tret1-like [Galleria mellonella]
MDNCKYEDIRIPEIVKSSNKHSWRPILRQSLIGSGVLAYPFMYGLSFGSPTVLIHQLRREANSTAAVSDEMESWLSSCMIYSSIPAAIILTILADAIGRKRTCLVLSLTSLSGYLLFYLTNNLKDLLISQSIQGVLAAAHITTSAMALTEYLSPQYRGVFLNIKGVSLFWGVWVSNAMGTFLHWKTISLLGSACAFYTILSVLIWPESPYWLSEKGRYDECAKSHRWLKGSSLDAEKELQNLIAYKANNKSDVNSWKQLLSSFKMMSQKEVYKPMFLCILLMALQQFSVYKYLPETKDKTLVEIAETFRELPKTDTLMVPLNDNNKILEKSEVS